MKKSTPPPYSLTEPNFVARGDILKVVETTPYSWILLFEKLREEAKKRGENCLEELHSLGWFLYLLHQYKPKKNN